MIDIEKQELVSALERCVYELIQIARLQDWHSQVFIDNIDNANRLIEKYKDKGK